MLCSDGLPVNIVFKALLAYVAVSFLIMEVLYFAVWCRPFHNYWAIPPPSKQCSAATNHLITNAVLNISSDLIMLIVAFSIFYRSRLPWDRKLILSCVFGLGIFVILCAVLNKYYSFAHPYGTQWTYWYVRESSTTLIIANIPFMWTILRHIFKLNAFHHERPKMVAYHSQRSARGRGRTHQHSGAGGQKPNMTLNTTNTTKSMNGAYSADSSMVEGEPSSPISIRHPSAALGKGQKVASWKTQGFYGREEFDALAIEPWDYGNEELIAADSVTVSTDRGSAGHSPRMTHSRRLRDEEAQYAMQEGNSLKYHDFMIMKEEDTIQETDLDHGKETDLDHGNETDLNHGKDVIPEKVAESVG